MADLSSTKVAVLGGGSVGSTIAKEIAKSGKAAKVTIAARDPAKTTKQLEEKGLGAVLAVGPKDETIADSNVLILATPGVHDTKGIQEFAESLAGSLKPGTVVIDATNPLSAFPDGLQVRWSDGTSGGEELAKRLPNAKVYKSFNTVGVEHMNNPCGKDMMIAGDADKEGRATTEAIVSAAGFKPIYVGPIRYSRNLEAIAELWIHMGVAPLPARSIGRKFWFSISGKIDEE